MTCEQQIGSGLGFESSRTWAEHRQQVCVFLVGEGHILAVDRNREDEKREEPHGEERREGEGVDLLRILLEDDSEAAIEHGRGGGGEVSWIHPSASRGSRADSSLQTALVDRQSGVPSITTLAASATALPRVPREGKTNERFPIDDNCQQLRRYLATRRKRPGAQSVFRSIVPHTQVSTTLERTKPAGFSA